MKIIENAYKISETIHKSSQVMQSHPKSYKNHPKSYRNRPQIVTKYINWAHMRDGDVKIAGFRTNFERGRNGRGPGPQHPLKKIKNRRFGGFSGSRPYFPYWMALLERQNEPTKDRTKGRN